MIGHTAGSTRSVRKSTNIPLRQSKQKKKILSDTAH